jgi:hypothetical protein
MVMFASVFDPYPYYDGPLALILCLITKFVSIELDLKNEENLSMTRLMLEDMKWTSGSSCTTTPSAPSRDFGYEMSLVNMRPTHVPSKLVYIPPCRRWSYAMIPISVPLVYHRHYLFRPPIFQAI